VIIHEDIEPILHAQVVLEIVKHSNTMWGRPSKSEFTGVFCTIMPYMQHYTVVTVVIQCVQNGGNNDL
jgi:hypothetical protein